jgi:hypothetical protein
MPKEGSSSWKLVLTAVLSGATAAVGTFLSFHLQSGFEVERAEQAYALRAWTELVGPAVMQMDRSLTAFERYRQSNKYGDATILAEANRSVRDLLLSKAHLMTPSLFAKSKCLITHYDMWLQGYEDSLRFFREIHGREPRVNEPFAVIEGGGPCANFPRDVPAHYARHMTDLRDLVYEGFPKIGAGANSPKPLTGQVNPGEGGAGDPAGVGTDAGQ